MTYVITAACIDSKDRSGIELCPVDCIYDEGDQGFIAVTAAIVSSIEDVNAAVGSALADSART